MSVNYRQVLWHSSVKVRNKHATVSVHNAVADFVYEATMLTRDHPALMAATARASMILANRPPL